MFLKSRQIFQKGTGLGRTCYRCCERLVQQGTSFQGSSSVSFTTIISSRSQMFFSLAVLKNSARLLPRSSLLTIYKTFVRSHFDYAGVVYDQSYKSSFHEKLESIQYNATLAVTCAIRGPSSKTLYKELGLESLQSRRWFRKLCQFYKILKNKSPRYLFNIIPTKLRVHNTRYCDNIPLLKIKYNYFRNSFFSSSVTEWNKLSWEVRNSENIRFF